METKYDHLQKLSKSTKSDNAERLGEGRLQKSDKTQVSMFALKLHLSTGTEPLEKRMLATPDVIFLQKINRSFFGNKKKRFLPHMHKHPPISLLDW